jgi:RimJ/RimL family protein N-acetyltransferase
MFSLVIEETSPERIVLASGSSATISELRPEHARLVVEGFEHLSPRSRYLRFFTPKSELSPNELWRLMDIDGHERFALGASVRRDSEWVPAAVARFARVHSQPDSAEPALTVVDEFQGLGLGTALYARLVRAAQSRGYSRFIAEVLPENERMLRIFRRVTPGCRIFRRETVLEVEIDLGAYSGASAQTR